MTPRFTSLVAAGGLCVLAALLAHETPEVQGCRRVPPPTTCGRTIVFSKAMDGVHLLTGGGTFVVPTLSFIGFSPMSEFCPPTFAIATIDIAVSCDGGPGGTGTVTTAVFPGFNEIEVPVTLPPGPPRLCNVVGTITVSFNDGLVLTQNGDTVVCIVEPSPDLPGQPRLDLDILSPDVVVTHPGDQATYDVCITNNDAGDPWTGTLTGRMNHTGDLPDVVNPGPNGSGPYSTGDPGDGDDFPLEWQDLLPPNGCLSLPPIPHEENDSSIERPVTLEPGESATFTVVTRSWGGCGTGDCGELTLVADGLFGDGTPGIACGGAVYAVDANVAPSYAWEDAGKRGPIFPPIPFNPFLETFNEPFPFPGGDWGGTIFVNPGPIVVDGEQLLWSSVNNGFRLDDHDGRIQTQYFEPGDSFIVDSFFDVFFDIEVAPTEIVDLTLQSVNVVEGAPSGFETLAPVGHATYLVETDTIVSRYDLEYQLSGNVIDENFASIPIEIIALDLTADAGKISVHVVGQAQTPPGPTGPDIIAVELYSDFRGHARPAPAPCIGDLNEDGVVNVADLIGVLGAWGTPGGDVTGDGITNVQDLLAVLGNFGDCP